MSGSNNLIYPPDYAQPPVTSLAGPEEKHITLAHGAGGAVMQKLIKEHMLKGFGKERKGIEVSLSEMDDSAVVEGIVFTTDSYTVKPIFFPGGDIGKLAVCGTVNDLSVMGAEPLSLSCGFVLEEGFGVEDLGRIVKSMAVTSRNAGVPIVTGDTKVIEKGGIDKLVINTSGIGRHWKLLEQNNREVRRFRRFNENWLKDSNLRPGDRLIVSGTIGDHGIAVLSKREGYDFETEVLSDVAPLNKTISLILKKGGIVAMKDPTRGGLANALNEWSEKSKVGILVEECSIPVRDGVRSACEMLGIDPLEIGNEGKIIIGTVKEKADDILAVLRRTKEGRSASVIGECRRDIKGVVMTTTVGGKRIIEQPAGDPVPRIC